MFSASSKPDSCYTDLPPVDDILIAVTQGFGGVGRLFIIFVDRLTDREQKIIKNKTEDDAFSILIATLVMNAASKTDKGEKTPPNTSPVYEIMSSSFFPDNNFYRVIGVTFV